MASISARLLQADFSAAVSLFHARTPALNSARSGRCFLLLASVYSFGLERAYGMPLYDEYTMSPIVPLTFSLISGCFIFAMSSPFLFLSIIAGGYDILFGGQRKRRKAFASNSL